MKLQKWTTIRLDTRTPYDFSLTIHKPAGWNLFAPSEVYESGTMWTGLRLENKPLGLKLRSSGNRYKPTIIADVFSARKLDRSSVSRLKGLLESKLSVHENLDDFYRLSQKDSVLKYAVEDLYGMHSTDDSSLFSIALLAITLQMAPLKRSQEMLDSIVNNYGTTISFDGKKVRLYPMPETLGKVAPSVLKKRCNVGYRAKNIVNMAKMIANGFLSLEELKAMPLEESKKRLMNLPGIGDYSADIINPGGGFPIDAWSVEVFGELFFGRKPSENRAAIEGVKKEGLRRWGKWSWYAFLYVVNDLENLSKKLSVKLRLE